MLQLGDVFHTGFVVDDIDAAMRELADVFGVTWTPLEERDMALRGPDGPMPITLRFTYTREGPHRLELLEAVAGTLWRSPPAGVGGPMAAHHVGVWCDDVPGVSRQLEDGGSPRLATYDSDRDDARGFAYHRLPGGTLVELVDSSRKPGFERWFAGGPFPAPSDT